VRLKLISCEIFYREMCTAVARSPHLVDVEFLPKGLHDIGSAKMSARLQEAVDAVDAKSYEAILLGYALCGTGLVGLTARTIPLVLPRAHDCITLFLGSKERYLEYFQNTPGVYFKTSGWIERGETSGRLTQLSFGKSGEAFTYSNLVEKYGEENAQYLYDTLCDHTKNYRHLTFLRMGFEADGSFEARAREHAARKNLQYHEEEGSLRLIRALINGPWSDEEFLTVPPGHRVRVDYSAGLITAEKAESPGAGKAPPAPPESAGPGKAGT
jgi:hypothetical protein